jgi:predicted tellurium resistance membrane protein TerC
MLALAFIVLIGVYLVIEGLEIHVPKAYVYGPMGFSALVETLNLWAKRRALARGSED